MNKNESLIPIERIEQKIYVIRNERVMLDSDLADIYGVTTRALNQAVKRNLKRFPEDFMFRLTADELEAMRSQSVTASKRNVRFPPYVFTEHGAIMAANILSSERAVEASVQVVRAFVKLRQMLLLQMRNLQARSRRWKRNTTRISKSFSMRLKN